MSPIGLIVPQPTQVTSASVISNGKISFSNPPAALPSNLKSYQAPL
jgi:hypothetical protein